MSGSRFHYSCPDHTHRQVIGMEAGDGVFKCHLEIQEKHPCFLCKRVSGTVAVQP